MKIPAPALLLLALVIVSILLGSVEKALDMADTIMTAGALALALRGQNERRNDG